jgi:hypothetical protein
MMDWKTGSIQGFVIGPETNDADSWSGGFRGKNHSLHPKLRITVAR